MTPTVALPEPPAHLPEHMQKRWSETHKKAFAQAKIDHPNNESAQRATALKAANALLAVPAPTSASDIDRLEPWQVLHRETRTVKGKEHRVCVTSDGRKYSHPVEARKASSNSETKNSDESGDKK